jgi:CubicO group peptidase (beta-lactamase class C family)
MSRLKLACAIAVALSAFAHKQASTAADGLLRVHPDQVGLSAEKLKQVDALLRDHVSCRQIAGAVALVARHGKIAYENAVGMQDVEAGIAMSPGTIFRIASMTKPITSTAVMQLVDQGRIDLSDPVSRYLPEFKFMQVAVPEPKKDAKSSSGGSGDEYNLVPAYRPITIRDLLTHTSGLCYRFSNQNVAARLYASVGICDGLNPCDHTLADNVRRLARLPLAHQPGTAWEYGLSTDVLGRLVEVVSGKSLDAYLYDRIFAPLAMHDTHFVLPESKRGRLAALYEPGPKGRITRVGEDTASRGQLFYSASLPYKGTSGYFSGGAGLVSTAADYARFLLMLLNYGELAGARILRPETAQAMTRDQTGSLPLWIPVHGPQFGYGFGIANGSSADAKKDPAGTFSWGGIYYTDFWVDPKHELIGIMLTQVFPSTHLKLRDDFHRLVNVSVEP